MVKLRTIGTCDPVSTMYPKPIASAMTAASFFAGSPPEWLAEVTGERSLRAAGVFEPGPVAALMAKGARTRGVRMSNTDNMRVLAVLSTQLTHAQFVAGDGGTPGEGALPDPDVAADLAGTPSPSPLSPAARRRQP